MLHTKQPELHLAMAQADNFAVSFNLGLNFDENLLETQEASEILLPEPVLADLMQDIHEN